MNDVLVRRQRTQRQHLEVVCCGRAKTIMFCSDIFAIVWHAVKILAEYVFRSFAYYFIIHNPDHYKAVI